MKKIQVLFIADNRFLREGIAAMLKKQPDINVATTLGNAENVLSFVDKLNYDILLLDLGLQNQNSLEIVKLIKQHFQQNKIIVMNIIPFQTNIFEFVQAGVKGFILQDARVNDFLKTIRLVWQEEQVLPPCLTGTLFSQIVEHDVNESKSAKLIEEETYLTKREQEVIELIADGSSNKEIAQKLHLSPYTIKSHVHNILEKLTLQTRLQIAKYAHTNETYKASIKNNSLKDK